MAYCKIAELKPGPAMKSNKIKEGDRIVAVAQSNAPPVDVVDMHLNKIVQLVRGPEGTEVRLTDGAGGQHGGSPGSGADSRGNQTGRSGGQSRR
jgi:C-terminal processing protease CtpA/Prc